MSTPSNPFATTEAWEVSSGSLIPPGDHKVTIQVADASGKSSGGYPQVELTLTNEHGTLRDWLVITERTIGKIVQVIGAIGVAPPTDAQVNPSTYALDPNYVKTWEGKRVGIHVRDEPDRMDPMKTRTRVKSYVPEGDLEEKLLAPAPAPPVQDDWSGSTPPGAFPASTPGANDDLPF